MGSKNFTIFLNIVGSGYKLGRCIPHPSVQNFRKLKRCANSNNYHISAQKLKEIQKHINEGKKESQKKLSVSLNDKSLEDKKEVLNDIEKIESLKISGTSELAADTSNQSNTGKTSLPLKPEKESRGSVQEDVSKTIGKLQGEKIYEENQTKPTIGLRNEKEKGRKLNMIDSIRREMKSSYSSLRKKQLQEHPSISNLFVSRPLSEDKEKTNIIKDINAKVFNTFDSIVSNRVESEQTEKNDKLFEENSPQKTQIVEEEKTDIIKDMNARAFNTFDSIVSKRVESIKQTEKTDKLSKENTPKVTQIVEKEETDIIKDINAKALKTFESIVSKRVESIKQTEKNDNLFKENSPQKTQIVEEGSIDKEKVNASGKKTKEKENKDSLKKDLFNKENIFLPQEKKVKSVGEKQIDKAEENILKEKTKISGETVVLKSESMSKTNLNVSVNEVDRPSTQKYMLNTLLDPIAKSSQKKMENRGLSSQSGEDLNEIKGSAGRKPQKIDEQVPEQKQKIDKSIKPGMGNTKMEASNSTRLLLKENTEDNSKEKIVHRSDIISNQQIEQKNQLMPKMINHQSSILGEEMNGKEASTDLLEENIVQLSNKIKDQELERIMKQKVAKKNQEKPEIDDKLNVSRKEDNKIGASTNSLKGDVESGSNGIKIEKSYAKVDKKIIGQSRSVGKLNSSNMGKLKTQSSKTPPGKGRAKPKPKSTLKVKYRLKETLNHKLQINDKSENMNKIITDEKSAVAHKKVDQKNPVRKEIKLDKESAVVHEKFDLQKNPVRKEINHHKESASAHEKVDKQKPVKKEIQLHKEHHSALTKQEEFPKIASQVAATVENFQSIEKSLDKIAVKQDFNERGILPFDSSYIMKQLAKSRQSESILEIPGPRVMRVCSNIVNALPVIGTLTISSLMRSYNRLCLSYGDKKIVSNRMSKPLESLFNKHGDIVCLNIPLCGNVILVDKPELIHEVYRQRDMSQITNSSFDSLNEVYNVLGKKNMRIDAISSVDDHMTCVIEHFDLKNLFWSANRYHDSLEKISDLLVQRITFTRDMHNEVPEDFIKELNKWSLECMMQVLFATEIGSLRSTSYLGHQETDRVLKSLTDATDALRNCESGIQLWRVFETSSFTKLAESIKNLERFLCKHIPLLRHDTKLEQRLEMLQSNLESKQNASSLISGLILSGYVDVDKLLKICMETMLIAVNTTSTSLGFVLYHLARNQEKQKVLHKELISVLPDKTSKLNPEVLQELPYLNACVQETLRLKHPIPYSIMRLQRSIVLHKYYIPAGTWVMTANEVACLREENFEDAQLFKPERWLECSPELYQDTISPLLEAQFEPFLGRDWLQKQLLVGTAKIIRNFNVRYRYGEIGKEGEFLSKPTKPFQFEFLEQHV